MDLRCPQCNAEFSLADEEKSSKVRCPCGCKFLAVEQLVVPPVPAKPELRPPTGPVSRPMVTATADGSPRQPGSTSDENPVAPPPPSPTKSLGRTSPVATVTAALPQPSQAGVGKWVVVVLLALLVLGLLLVLSQMIIRQVS